MDFVNSASGHIYIGEGLQPLVVADQSEDRSAIGDIRYDSGYGMLVWNGIDWTPISSNSVYLTKDAEDAINWAVRKMKEENELAAMMDEYPSLKEAKQNLDAMIALLKDYNKEKS